MEKITMDERIKFVNKQMEIGFGEDSIQIYPSLKGLQICSGIQCFHPAGIADIDKMIDMLCRLRDLEINCGVVDAEGNVCGQ